MRDAWIQGALATLLAATLAPAPAAAQGKPVPGYGERWRDSGLAWRVKSEGEVEDLLSADVELEPGEWLWVRDQGARRVRLEVEGSGDQLGASSPHQPELFSIPDPRTRAWGVRDPRPPLGRGLVALGLRARALSEEGTQSPDERDAAREEEDLRRFEAELDQPGEGWLAVRAQRRGHYRLRRLVSEQRAESWERLERLARGALAPEEEWPRADRWALTLPGLGVARFAQRQASVLPWPPEEDQRSSARRLRLAHLLLVSPTVRPHLRGRHLERHDWRLEGLTFRDGPCIRGHGDPSAHTFTRVDRVEEKVQGPACLRVLVRGTASHGGAPPRLGLRLRVSIGEARRSVTLLPTLDLRASERLRQDEELGRALAERGLRKVLLTSPAELRLQVPPGEHQVQVASVTSDAWLAIQTLERVEQWDLRSPEGFLSHGPGREDEEADEDRPVSAARVLAERALSARLEGRLAAARESVSRLLEESREPAMLAWGEVEALELALAVEDREAGLASLARIRRRLAAGAYGSEALAQRARVAALAAIEAGWAAPRAELAWGALRAPRAAPEDVAAALACLARTSTGARLELGTPHGPLALRRLLRARAALSARRAFGTFARLPRLRSAEGLGCTFASLDPPWPGSPELERTWIDAEASAGRATYARLKSGARLEGGSLELRWLGERGRSAGLAPLTSDSAGTGVLQAGELRGLAGVASPGARPSPLWIRLAEARSVELASQAPQLLGRGAGVTAAGPRVVLHELPPLDRARDTEYRLPPARAPGVARVSLGVRTAERAGLDVPFSLRLGEERRGLRLVRLGGGGPLWARAEVTLPPGRIRLGLRCLDEDVEAYGKVALGVVGRRRLGEPGLPLLPLAVYFLSPGGDEREELLEALARTSRELSAGETALQQSRARWERACLLTRLDRTHAAVRDLERLRGDAYLGSRARHSLAALHLLHGSLAGVRREVEALENSGHHSPSLAWLGAAAALARSPAEARGRLAAMSPPPAGTLAADWYTLLAVESGLSPLPPESSPADPKANLPKLLLGVAGLRRWSAGATQRELLRELRAWGERLSRAAKARLESGQGALARRLAGLRDEARQAAAQLAAGRWPPAPGLMDPFAPWSSLPDASISRAPGQVVLQSPEARWRAYRASPGTRLRCEVRGPASLALRWRHALAAGSVTPGCARIRLKGLPRGARTRVLLESGRSNLRVEGHPQLEVSFSDEWRVEVPAGEHLLEVEVELGAGVFELRQRRGRLLGAWGALKGPLVSLEAGSGSAELTQVKAIEEADRELAEGLAAGNSAAILRALARFTRLPWGGADDPHLTRHHRILRRLTRRRRVDISAWLPRTRTLLLAPSQALDLRQAMFHPLPGGRLLEPAEPASWRVRSEVARRLALEVVVDLPERVGPALGEARLALSVDKGAPRTLKLPLGQRRRIPLGERAQLLLEVVLKPEAGRRLRARARLVRVQAGGVEPLTDPVRTRWHRARAEAELVLPGPGLMELEELPLAAVGQVAPGVWRVQQGVSPTIQLYAVEEGQRSAIRVSPERGLVRLLRHDVREERSAAWRPRPPAFEPALGFEPEPNPAWLGEDAPSALVTPAAGEHTWVLEPWLRGETRRRARSRPTDGEPVSDELRLGVGLHHRYGSWPLFERYRLSAILPDGQGPVAAADLRWQAYLSESPRISLRFLGQAFLQASEVGSVHSHVGDLRLRSNFRLTDTLQLLVDLHLNVWGTSVSRRRARTSERELYRRITSAYRRDHRQWSEAVVRLRWLPWQNLTWEAFGGARTNDDVSYGDPDRWWAGVSARAHWERLYLRASYVHLERLADADRARRAAEELTSASLSAEGWVSSRAWASIQVGVRYAHPSSALSAFFQLTIRLGPEGERLHAVDPELVPFWRHQDGIYPWPQQ